MTTINFHGHLGESIGSIWKLDVSSVGEAMHAINILSKRKLFNYLLECDKVGAKYKVLINNQLFKSKKKLNVDNINEIIESELAINRSNLKTIDVVPVIEGADSDIFAIIVGVVLIIVGIATFTVGGGVLIVAGLGLVAAGVINLLAKPPEFEDFTEGKKAQSYLFNGPENVTREGGPVPIGYGRLLIGSQVISASYELVDTNATEFEQ